MKKVSFGKGVTVQLHGVEQIITKKQAEEVAKRVVCEDVLDSRQCM